MYQLLFNTGRPYLEGVRAEESRYTQSFWRLITQPNLPHYTAQIRMGGRGRRLDFEYRGQSRWPSVLAVRHRSPTSGRLSDKRSCCAYVSTHINIYIYIYMYRAKRGKYLSASLCCHHLIIAFFNNAVLCQTEWKLPAGARLVQPLQPLPVHDRLR